MVRSRINERLARASRYPVTLIVAPAGFGKTTALRDFLSSAFPNAARYDLRREDATLIAFARGLADSASSLVPDIAAAFATLQPRLLGESDQLGLLMEWFAENLKSASGTIVLDDLHHASDPRAVPLLVNVIERTSSRIRWIVATRNDAGLPVASWLAYGRIDVPIQEEDLRFSVDEAIEAMSGAEIDEREAQALRDLVAGWPVALTLALHARMHASDLESTAAGTRDLLYRYLAEQVFHGLSERQRDVLLATSVVPAFETNFAQALGIRRDELRTLVRDVSFLGEVAPGQFRYHDLFRDFLEATLRSAGTDAYIRAHERAGAALVANGNDLAAMHLYTRSKSQAELIDILERSGVALFERGEAEALEASLTVVGAAQHLSAAALGVKAMLEAARGHFQLAERDFLDAIERASDPRVRLPLVHRYAIELVRHERDAVELLAPYAGDEALPANVRVPMLATLATALARAHRHNEAAAKIAAGIEAIDGTVDDDARARFYQQAAFVHHLLPARGHAWNYANLAIELAIRNGLYEVAARAYSVLYTIVADDEDDPLESLVLLERLIECARKAGSVQTRLYGLMASFEIQVERGDDVAVEGLEREMERASGTLSQTRAETLLPARAMRAASAGDFQHAYALLADTGEAQAGDERRALREAEIALYAFACGQSAEGEGARTRAAHALASCAGTSRRNIRTRLMLALTELVCGHAGAAHRYITDVERAGSIRSRRLRSFVNAVRTLYRRSLDQVDEEDVNAALERLAADQFGGLARMLRALPFAHAAENGAYALLTPAERRILSALARGATSKEIGLQSNRSAQTVDTHIRSICRKLRCSGRREAIALAMRSGWVES